MSLQIEYNVLLVFDHTKGCLIRLTEFGDDEVSALAAYEATEVEFSDPSYEVVLIGSDCLDTVKRTHANYFEDVTATSKYLAGR